MPTHLFGSSLRRARLARPFLVVAGLLASFLIASSLTQPNGAGATGFQWNDGTIQESVITNCASIIQGSPYSESGAGTYVGYESNPASGEPFPGETYYVHVVVYGLGNSCAGQYADINVTLPPNTSTAVTGSTPIYCFADGVRDTTDCNQPLQSSAATYGSGSVRLPANNPSHANTWPLPQGHNWEFQIPVVSTASFISGQLVGHTKMLDGNSSPVLTPTYNLSVYSRTPTVTYPSSSTAINGANFAGSTYLSTAIIRPNGQGGSFFFDMMSGASVLYSDAGNVPNGTIGDYGVTENWIITNHPLSPSTTYMWRARFVTATNMTINGGTQSFTTPPTSGGTTTIAAPTTTTTTIAAGGGTPGGGTAPTTVAPPTTSPTTTVSTPGATPEYVPIVPARILETRTDPGSSTVDGQGLGHGFVAAEGTIELQVGGRAGVPGDAGAVALNVTVTDARATGFASVYPCGAARPTTSNLNFVAGQTIPNAVIAKLGTDGKVCIFTNVGTHLLADVNGYFPAASSYVPIVPARILETRTDPGSSTIDGQGLGQGIVAGGTEVALLVAGRVGVPNNARAAVLNVTVTGAQGNGYVTVYPCGATRPTTSNLNFVVGQTIPDAVITKIGDGGKVCIFANVGTHLLADIDGYFPAGSSYSPIVPGRILDTRTEPGSSTIDGAFLGHGILSAGDEIQLQVTGRSGVPNSATAAVLNVTVTAASGNGYVTVYPCGATRPITSNLNFVAGQTIPNAVIAKIGTDGKVCIYANVGTHLIADVNGYFPG